MPRLSIRVEHHQGLFIASEAAHRDLVGFGLSEEEAIGELLGLLARQGLPQPDETRALSALTELKG